ncbi:BolA-like protein 3 [Fusarium oxysporum f. sp. albedinis]|nr:BolA-like protein 3 [Fusarium oxysporum f. sp. albedinis]
MSTKASPEHIRCCVYTKIPTLGEPRYLGIFTPSDRKDWSKLSGLLDEFILVPSKFTCPTGPLSCRVTCSWLHSTKSNKT